MSNLLKSLIILSLCCMAATSEAATIYTCEINGKTVYTSRPSGNCHSANLPAIGKYSSSRDNTPKKETSVSVNTAAKPKSNHTEHKTASTSKAVTNAATPAPVIKSSGSNSRRAILEAELSNERKALSEAQKSLAQARAAHNGSVDRQQVSRLEGAVIDRQQNIQALQRELGRM